jgi:hypothetical protein
MDDNSVGGATHDAALRRIRELEAAFQSQIAKVDAWAADTRPGRAHEVLMEVGQIARAARSGGGEHGV